MEESIKMRKHLKTVAIIQIVRSSLWLILAILVVVGLTIALGVVEDDVAHRILSIVIATFPVVLGVLGTLGLVGGIGLLSLKPWGRIITLILSGMGCLVIPIGTLIGVYSIWVLMQDESVRIIENK
jgi:hypothetical protein